MFDPSNICKSKLVHYSITMEIFGNIQACQTIAILLLKIMFYLILILMKTGCELNLSLNCFTNDKNIH